MPVIVPSSTTTKTVQDAINRAQSEFKGITLNLTDALDFANEVYQIVGTATYWNWLLVDGQSFGTVNATMDYYKVPADLNKLRAAWIWDDSSGYTPLIPLRIFEQMQPTNIRSIPRAISVEGGTYFRLVPRPNQSRPGGDANPGQTATATPGTAGSSGQWLVVYEYYKRPELLTLAADTFEFDDEFYPTFFAGFVARVADFLDEDRAGVWSGRNIHGQFEGQGMWGHFASLLNEEVRVESLTSGQPVYAPAEPIYLDVP